VAPGALELDTSELGLEEVVERLAQAVRGIGTPEAPPAGR
jgi:hypothetical protein